MPKGKMIGGYSNPPLADGKTQSGYGSVWLPNVYISAGELYQSDGLWKSPAAKPSSDLAWRSRAYGPTDDPPYLPAAGQVTMVEQYIGLGYATGETIKTGGDPGGTCGNASYLLFMNQADTAGAKFGGMNVSGAAPTHNSAGPKVNYANGELYDQRGLSGRWSGSAFFLIFPAGSGYTVYPFYSAWAQGTKVCAAVVQGEPVSCANKAAVDAALQSHSALWSTLSNWGTSPVTYTTEWAYFISGGTYENSLRCTTNQGLAALEYLRGKDADDFIVPTFNSPGSSEETSTTGDPSTDDLIPDGTIPQWLRDLIRKYITDPLNNAVEMLSGLLWPLGLLDTLTGGAG